METWKGTEALIISGAPVEDVSYVSTFLHLHPSAKIICADAGIRHLHTLQRHPDLIIGDFDSITPPEDLDCERICLPPEKDYTDTTHALQVVIDRGCKSVWIVCATGGRLDHLLSNLSLCEYAWERGCVCHILDAQNEVSFLPSGGTRVIPNEPNFRYFSLVPLDAELTGLTITGAKYSVNQVSVSRSTMFTISNECAANTVQIHVKKGRALLIRSRDRA